MKSLHAAWVGLGIGIAASMPLGAQTYPTKPIRVVSMATSSADAYFRAIAQKASEALGQQMIVDPLLGAGGSIAAEAVARSAPDGYTILGSYPDAIVQRHLLVRKMTYDPIKDFTPISQLVDPLIFLAANLSMPATLKEIIAQAKANPGKLSYGSLGIGSSFHLTGEELKQLTGTDMLHVPFKTGPDSYIALANGDLSLLVASTAIALPNHRAGKIRIIAAVNDQRSPQLPDIPSLRELVPGFESPAFWLGVLGPANMPAPVVTRLNRELVRSATLEENRNRATEIGFRTVASSAEEFRVKVRGDIDKANKIAKSAGIQPE